MYFRCQPISISRRYFSFHLILGPYLEGQMRPCNSASIGGSRPARYQTDCMGASGNLGAGERWAGRVCSVICQVHSNIFVAVKTVPILDATVVVPGVLCLGGPCAGLHRGRLAQSCGAGAPFNRLMTLCRKSWNVPPLSFDSLRILC